MSANKTKRLTLVRHASAEQEADVRDFERPLSRKGHNEALDMARRFQERGLTPDLILTSAATRTRETAEAFAKVLGVAARLLQSQLFGVTPRDTTSYVVGTVAIAAAALVASWLPARRAAAIAPVEALRTD